MAGFSASAGAGPTVSNSTIDQLAGTFVHTGASIGETYGLGSTFDASGDGATWVAQIAVLITAKFPFPGEFHAGGNYTCVFTDDWAVNSAPYPFNTYGAVADAIFFVQGLAQ